MELPLRTSICVVVRFVVSHSTVTIVWRISGRELDRAVEGNNLATGGAHGTRAPWSDLQQPTHVHVSGSSTLTNIFNFMQKHSWQNIFIVALEAFSWNFTCSKRSRFTFRVATGHSNLQATLFGSCRNHQLFSYTVVIWMHSWKLKQKTMQIKVLA